MRGDIRKSREAATVWIQIEMTTDVKVRSVEEKVEVALRQPNELKAGT
jgi:hypothetical protein